MKHKKLLSLILSAMLLVSGCTNTDSNSDNNNTNTSNENNTDTNDTSNTTSQTDFAQNESDMFTERDSRIEYDENNSIKIELNGSSAICNSNSVQISGSTITITDEGTYIFSGTLDNGMIIVNAQDTDKPQLVFDNVTIHSETSAPLYILEADKVFVTLANGSFNRLSNGGTFTAIDDNNIDAAIFSKQDITFNGTGSLTVTSPAGHGIVSKDDLVVTSGTYDISSASHGLSANDSVRMKDTTLTITSGKDGIQAENSDDTTLGFVYIANGDFTIDAQGDGMSAGSYMQIENGTFDIISGGGSVNAEKQESDSWGNFMGGGGMGGGRPESSQDKPTDNATNLNNNSQNNSSDTTDSTSIKGLKASGNMLINNGTFTIDAADDAIHSNTSITINGGTFQIATGDDGIHADETLTITSGTIDITESYEGLEALNIAISDGAIFLVSSDDGFNAAGGTDSSGFGGHRRNDMFGGGMGGHNASSNSNGSITISGGSVFMYASGDGIDANGSIHISGGSTIVTGPTTGDTAILDYDTTATITNGTFIGVGSTMMAQTFSSDSTQGCFAVTTGNISGGTNISLKDTNGSEVISFTPETSFACVILSTPDIIKGNSYTITVGDTSGTFQAN